MLLINDIPVNYFQFPGGELQVKVPDGLADERVTLTWLPTRPEDPILLLLTTNALKHAGYYDIHLDCLYLPYARQDRVCAPGEALSLEVMCKMLEDADYSQINFWDNHNSEKIEELIKRTCWLEAEAYDIIKQYRVIDKIYSLAQDLYICAADQGAIERAEKVAHHPDVLANVLIFSKQRNSATGEITGLSYDDDNPELDDEDILIVDDICDGGTTFLKAAEILKTLTEGKLYLYVTHGIFSKGVDELLQHFTHIYCHHVHRNPMSSSPRLTILREFPNA